MQVNVSGHHIDVTPPLRQYVSEKLERIQRHSDHLVKANCILTVEKLQHKAEAMISMRGIQIYADAIEPDMYAAIDETIDKIARRMRKHKTRLLRKHRPNRRKDTIRHLDEKIFAASILDDIPAVEEPEADPEPMIIHREAYRLRTLLKEEAIMELELSDKPFIVYNNERRDVMQILYRRKDGDYAIIEP